VPGKPARGSLLDLAPPAEATETESKIEEAQEQEATSEKETEMVEELEKVPDFAPSPTIELRRHTFYADDEMINLVKYYALIDKRPQSEILREATHRWLHERRKRKSR